MKIKYVSISLAVLVLTGCAGYGTNMAGPVAAVQNGRPDEALAKLEAKNSANSDKNLLYYMEKGQLQRLNNDVYNSTISWRSADAIVQQWEDNYKTDPNKVLGNIGSYVINDTFRTYEGQDFEKVMLTTEMAVNQAAMGNWDEARIEIKKTHEREAIIEDIHDKLYAKEEQEAKNKGIKTSFSSLNGYPVDTLNDPAVMALKNGYQSAFSHYLAGYIYEALGDVGLAAPGYRQAIELQPNTPQLKTALAGLESRLRQARGNTNKTDVLFVIESGLVPHRSSQRIPIPIPRAGFVSVSFPVMRGTGAFVPNSISVGDNSLAVDELTNVDAMARRTLRDDMPGIILRTTLRAISKGVAQSALQKRSDDKQNPWLGLAAGVLSIAGQVTEQADERGWSTLPNRIAIARGYVAPGNYNVLIPTQFGTRSIPIVIKGKHMIVPVRLLNNQLYTLQPDTIQTVAGSVKQ